MEQGWARAMWHAPWSLSCELAASRLAWPWRRSGRARQRQRRVARKVALALGEAVRSPGPSRRMATAVAMSGQQRGRDALAITLNWLTIRALVRRCRRGQGFHVFDQAALMSLWSTGLRGDASAGRALLERPEWCWVLPDAVLRVEASHEQTVVRLRGRGERQSRLEALADGELRAELERAAADAASLVGWWGTRGPMAALPPSSPSATPGTSDSPRRSRRWHRSSSHSTPIASGKVR